MLHEITWCILTKKVADRGKRSKVLLSNIKPVKNISKNLQSFLEIGCLQKEDLSSHRIKEK